MVLSDTNADDLFSVDEMNSAVRAVTGPFSSVEEKWRARARYDAIMQVKRDSGYQLPSEPLV
jgi:hypothetical protein